MYSRLAALVPGQRAMRQEMGKLGDRMSRLEERMARLEGWLGGFLQGKREADVQQLERRESR